MKIHVLPGQNLTASHVECWREIQVASPGLASAFFCPEYTLGVARARKDVGVAVLSSRGQTVGFFPLAAQQLAHGFAGGIAFH